jgi:hypothetical protein
MAYERTWAFSYNNPYTPTTNADLTKYQVWALKAMLLGQWGGLTQGLWATDSSCDSVTAGTPGDLVDRWGPTYDPTKIVLGAAGTPHSWYVLKSPLMNGFNFYLLVTTDSTPTGNARLFMAKTPFTGGTTTANPTSTDSWNVGNQTAFNDGTSAQVLNRFNIALSSVGDFVLFAMQAGQSSSPALCIAVVAPVGVNGSDNFPIWTFKHHQNTAPGGFEGPPLFDDNNVDATTRLSDAATGNISIPYGTVSANINTPDALTGKHMTLPCMILTNSATDHHTRGRLPDIMARPIGSAVAKSGLVIRDGSNNITHVSVGHLWIPCGPTIPFFS